jgi:hypothetical protein
VADDTKKEKALAAYSKARPYVYRGAKFAVPAALLSKMYTTKQLGPGVITAGAFAAGVADKALEDAGRVNSLRKEKRRKGMGAIEKNSGMNTDHDCAGGLFQRNPEALLSEGAETANIANTNQMLDDLFSRRGAMAKRAYSQLSSLFTGKEHYGRNTRLGMSASEASKLTTRAFKGE